MIRRGYRRALTIALVAACLAAPTAALPASASPEPYLATIDAYIENEMRDLHIPGLALGIVRGDQVVHLRGFGAADPAGRAVTAQTPFILASASKSFTALAIMQLVESGGIDLDAPVRRYLPAFRVADEAASARITVRHLLHHTSGLPENSAYGPMLSNDSRDEALGDRVRALESVPLSHDVGTAYEYTDANYDALGLVVQTVSGQSYESYIAEHVFSPLGMRHSYTNQSDARRNGLSGHRPPLLVRLPHPLRGAVLAGRHAQQLPHLQRSRHHPLPACAAQRRPFRRQVDSLVQGNRRHARACDPSGNPGHLLRHGMGIQVARRCAGCAPRRDKRQLLLRHVPGPPGSMGCSDLDQLRLAQPQRGTSARSQ